MGALSVDYSKRIESFVRQKGRLAVVGLGNEYRTDDGAGTAAIRFLKDSLGSVDNLALFDVGRNLVAHLSDIEKFQPHRILFIDAANLGTEPGEIMALDQKQIAEKKISTHENNLDMALAYFKIVLSEYEVLFVGVQFKSLEMSDNLTLTVEVKRAVEKLVRLITAVVTKK